MTDIESVLRLLLQQAPDPYTIRTWVNNEHRMMLTITDNDGSQFDFVVVGDNVLSWPLKPPTQYAAVEGFDALRSGV